MRFSFIGPLRKFRRLPLHDRLLLLEAFFCLALARVVIAALPFRHIAFLLARPLHHSKRQDNERSKDLSWIRWAILAAAPRAPWRAKCFEQGFAAQIMLRRRGVASVLYYGAAQDNKRGLLSHVWVRKGHVDVVGGEISHRFVTLARFPSTTDIVDRAKESNR